MDDTAQNPHGETTLSDSGATGIGPMRTDWLQLVIVCVAGFVVWLGFGAILPYLPVFLKEESQAPVWMIGLVAAAYYVGSFSLSAPLGRLSDSVGRKPVIVSGVVLYAVATLLFITTTHPLWFILFRFLEGVGTAAVTPAGQALVAELSTPQTRSRAYGLLTTAQFGGLVAGPMMAWPLYSLGGGGGKWAFYTIFLFGSALSALTAVALYLTVREPEHARRRRAQPVVRPPLRRLVTRPVLAFIVVAVTAHFAIGMFEVLWSLYLRHLGASMRYVGLTWIAFSFPMMLAFIGGLLADRYNRWALMFGGYSISALCYLVYGTASDFVLFLVVSVVEGLAVAWSYPAKQAFFVQVVPPRWLGSLQGLEQTGIQVGALAGTLLAPVLYPYLSGYVIAVGGVVSLGGLVVAAPILHREFRRLQEEPADDPGRSFAPVSLE